MPAYNTPRFSKTGQDFETCMFCGSRPLSREHIWGKWLDQRFPTEADDHNSLHTVIVGQLDSPVAQPHIKGRLQKPGRMLGRRLKAVCSECNNTWMSRIESGYKTIFDRIDTSIDIHLTELEVLAARKWFYLKLCLQQSIIVLDRRKADIRDNLKWTRDASDLDYFIDWRIFRDTETIPTRYRFYLFKNVAIKHAVGSHTLNQVLCSHEDGLTNEETCAMLLPKLGCLVVSEAFFDLSEFQYFANSIASGRSFRMTELCPGADAIILEDCFWLDDAVAKIAVNFARQLTGASYYYLGEASHPSSTR